MDIYLEKIRPEDNCFRFYEIRTSPDFFADASLLVHWGRIGRPGQVRIRGSGSIDDCERLGKRILKKRLQRGYNMPSSPHRVEIRSDTIVIEADSLIEH